MKYNRPVYLEMELTPSRSVQHVKVLANLELLWLAKLLARETVLVSWVKCPITLIQKLRMFPILTQKIRTVFPNRKENKKKLAHSLKCNKPNSSSYLQTTQQILIEETRKHHYVRVRWQGPLGKWRAGLTRIPGSGIFFTVACRGLLLLSPFHLFCRCFIPIFPHHPLRLFSLCSSRVKGICLRAHPGDTFKPLLLSFLPLASS